MGRRRVLPLGGVHAFSSRVVKPHGLTSLTLLIRVDLLRAVPFAIALRAVALGLLAVSTLALLLLARCAIAFVAFALPAASLLPGARLAVGRGGLGAALRCLDGGFLIVAGVTALVGVAIACHEGHGCGQYHGRDNNLLHLLLRLLFSTLRTSSLDARWVYILYVGVLCCAVALRAVARVAATWVLFPAHRWRTVPPPLMFCCVGPEVYLRLPAPGYARVGWTRYPWPEPASRGDAPRSPRAYQLLLRLGRAGCHRAKVFLALPEGSLRRCMGPRGGIHPPLRGCAQVRIGSNGFFPRGSKDYVQPHSRTADTLRQPPRRCDSSHYY